MPRLQTRAALVALACAAAFATPSDAVIIRSAQPFVGVTQWQYIQQLGDTTAPVYAREVVVNILEIDTQAAGIGFQMSPGNGALPGEVTNKKTSTFVNSINAQIGVNVGFWNTSSPYGSPHYDLNHIAASNGSVYSNAAGGEPMFNIASNGIAKIGAAGSANSTTMSDGTILWNAGGGNQRILTNGNVSAPNDSYTTALNPHTAVGTNADGTKLFLATVDGRQNDYSEGMRTDEFATVMKQFGAWNAINVDGGGSTTMVMDDTNDGTQNAHLVMSPSDNATPTTPGGERSVGSSLAVFATPLAGYVPLAPITRPGVTGVIDRITTPVMFDNFDSVNGSNVSGHFILTNIHNASGSTHDLAATSKATIDTTTKKEGAASLKVALVNTNDGTPSMQLRLLSGAGTPTNNLNGNKAMSNNGFVGYWLKMDANANPLYASILIDDGTTTSNGLERGEFIKVIADGEWHLYEWDLSEDGKWANFANGNSVIDGANAFIDSLYFSSTNATSGGPAFSGTFWIDGLGYNPDGRLSAVPEPTTLATLGLGGLLMRRRR